MKLISFWSKQVVVFTLRGYKAKWSISALGKRKKGRKKDKKKGRKKKEKEGKREKLLSAQMHTFLVLPFNFSQVQHQYEIQFPINQILHFNPAVPLALFKMLNFDFYANLNLVKIF